MSVRAPERPRAPEHPVHEAPPGAPAAGLGPVIAAGLAAAAAGWAAAGMFTGWTARVIGLAGAVLGAGVIGASTRARRPLVVQYLALPAAILIGWSIVLPDAGGATVIGLIGDALRGGGLAQPPVPFDPGWRFLLFVLTAAVGAGAASAGLATGRPRLAVALPVPLLIGAALLQPAEGELATTGVSVALFLGALAVASGADLSGEGSRRGFESRRLTRGAVLLVVLVAGIAGISRASFLFPERTAERVVPAQRPPAGMPQADRLLFTVRSTSPGPWRIGVLDGYDGSGWLLPPFDPARLIDVPGNGTIPGAAATSQTTTGDTVEATFTIADIPGHVVPSLAEPVAVRADAVVQIDPRTGTLRLPEQRAGAGMTYIVEAPAPPGGKALAAAGPPPASMQAFLTAPPPPNAVVALLERAPDVAWERVVLLRAALYRNVIAAGAGAPVDVLPSRVAAMLDGAEASPFEITAAEALLARWAGVPSRIGYGFYGGDVAGGSRQVHPRHAATWLELWFDGHGWVPVVGVPPRARASLAPGEQQQNPNVQPSEELALIVYVPIQLQSVQQLYSTVRYWLAVGAPPLLGLAALWWLLPGAVKMLRSARRRRFARAHGPAACIAVAYAEMRDTATDLGLQSVGLTPLEFLARVESDDEHAELAWLVTRSLWGDLRRDLHAADAEHAEALARSVGRRLRRAQPGLNRFLAFGSRASLRAPFTDDVPTLWLRRAGLPPAMLRAILPVILLALLPAACARDAIDPGAPPGALPGRLVPATLAGLDVRREPVAEEGFARAGDASLLDQGRIWTLRRGEAIEAYVQIASFVGGVNALDDEVRDGVLGSIATGRFSLERLGQERAYIQQLPEQRMFAHFTPDGGAMVLLVARRAFPDADRAFAELLAYQRGAEATRLPEDPVYDPRRGSL